MNNSELPNPLSFGSFGGDINSFIALGPNILWGIFGLLILVIGFCALILFYHWLRYAFGDRMVIFAGVLYSIVVVTGFIIMLSSVNYYG